MASEKLRVGTSGCNYAAGTGSDNDFEGCAVADARKLIELCRG